jgi:hypothetical protein
MKLAFPFSKGSLYYRVPWLGLGSTVVSGQLGTLGTNLVLIS